MYEWGELSTMMVFFMSRPRHVKSWGEAKLRRRRRRRWVRREEAGGAAREEGAGGRQRAALELCERVLPAAGALQPRRPAFEGFHQPNRSRAAKLRVARAPGARTTGGLMHAHLHVVALVWVTRFSKQSPADLHRRWYRQWELGVQAASVASATRDDQSGSKARRRHSMLSQVALASPRGPRALDFAGCEFVPSTLTPAPKVLCVRPMARVGIGLLNHEAAPRTGSGRREEGFLQRTACVLSSRSSSGSAYLLRLAVNTMTSNFCATSVCDKRATGQLEA